MENVSIIKGKIEKLDRRNIVFFHPVASDEQICKYISAFSNTEGGNIVFGVKDDGNKLHYKSSVFKIASIESKIRSYFYENIQIKFGSFKVGDSKIIEYINVETAEELISYEGESYIIDESNNVNKIDRKNIFLSYCQKDGCIADILEKEISPKLKNVVITRDIRDVEYKESFAEFMQTIGLHDYVISIISDKYLKSRNCMYELVEVMRDRNFDSKLLFVTVSDDDLIYYDDKSSSVKANVYSFEGQTEYIMHWKNEESIIKKQIKLIDDPMHSVEHSKELGVIKKIQLDIVEFMSYLRDRKGIGFNEMHSSEFVDIVQHITSK